MTEREKTYALLARLHNREMEAQAGALVSLQDEAAALQAEREALERSRRESAAVTMIEAMPYRASFLTTLRQENQRITAALADLDRRIERQREEVLACYRDARSSEALEEEERAAARARPTGSRAVRA